MSKLIQARLGDYNAFSCVPKIRLLEAIEALAELTRTTDSHQGALVECASRTVSDSDVLLFTGTNCSGILSHTICKSAPSRLKI